MAKACKDCIFWEQHSQTKIGFCHFRPPRPVLDDKGNQKILWPFTGDEDWCGSFESRQGQVGQKG